MGKKSVNRKKNNTSHNNSNIFQEIKKCSKKLDIIIRKQKEEEEKIQKQSDEKCSIIASLLTFFNKEMLVSLNSAKDKVVDNGVLSEYLESIVTPGKDNFLYISQGKNFETDLLAILKKSDTPLTKSANLAWWMEQKELREVLVDSAPGIESFVGYFRYSFIALIRVLYNISINLPEIPISKEITRYRDYDNGEPRISQLFKSYEPSKYDKCEIYRLSYNNNDGACYIY